MPFRRPLALLLIALLAAPASAGDFVSNSAATLPGPWSDSVTCNGADPTELCASQLNTNRAAMFDLREPFLYAPLVTTQTWTTLGNEKVIPVCSGSGFIWNGTAFACTTSSTPDPLPLTQGVQLNTTDSIPVCTSTLRGRLWVDRAASGNFDAAYACLKNADDTYGWAALGWGSSGGGGGGTTEPPPDTGTFGMWLTDSREKILPTFASRSTPSIALSAARNEFEPFQVVVHGPLTVNSLSVVIPDIPDANISMFREDYITITTSSLRVPPTNYHDWGSFADGSSLRVPDILHPIKDDWGNARNGLPITIPGGENRTFWVDVLVPANMAAGTYNGYVTVGTTANGAVSRDVNLTVRDFGGWVMPSTPTMKSLLRNGWPQMQLGHNFATDSSGGCTGACLATLKQMQARYIQFFLDHRLSLGHFDDGGLNGTSTTDFNTYYRVYATGSGTPAAGTFAPRLAGAKLTSLPNAHGSNLASAANLTSWNNYFFSTLGLSTTDVPFYHPAWDEPDISTGSYSSATKWANVTTYANRANSTTPTDYLKFMLTTSITNASSQGVSSSLIDIFVPNIGGSTSGTSDIVAGYGGASKRADYNSWLAGGGHRRLWLYQSCSSHGCGDTVFSGFQNQQWPSYMVDASAVRNRCQAWQNYSYDASGELYYATLLHYAGTDANVWTQSGLFIEGGIGDGALVYPGNPSSSDGHAIGGTDVMIPLASMRLKMMREGIEDYEYMRKAETVAPNTPTTVRTRVQQLFPNAYSCRPNSDTRVAGDMLMTARAAIANMIGP